MTAEAHHPDYVLAGCHPWLATPAAGLAGGCSMGVVLSLGTELMPAIGAAYGMASFLGGWLAHLANSVLFAVLFAAILSRPVVRSQGFTLETYLGLGLVYGAVLGLFSGGVLFPHWMNTAVSGGLPFPFVPAPGVGLSASIVFFALSHLAYGAVLGATYALLSRSVGVWPPRFERGH